MPNSMNITPPVVSTTPGPEWAQQINDILTQTIAEHNHQSPNGGVALTQDALNITGELSLNGNPITNVNSVGLATETSSSVSGTARLYNEAGDLYFRDGNGTGVRITENGGLAAASFGGISGLSGTQGSATFAGLSTFVWKKTATAYATMENGPVKIYSGNDLAPTAGITLTGKDGLASDITMSLSPFNTTMPQALPATQSFITLTTTGEQTASVSFNKGIVKSMVQSGSTDSDVIAAYVQTTANTWQNVGLSATLTTTGNPVLLVLQGYYTPQGGGSTPALPAGCVRVEGTAASTITKYFVRFSQTSGSTSYFGTTEHYVNSITNQDAGGNYTNDFPVNMSYMITSLPAGTYTFAVQGYLADNAANAVWYYMGFAATEL